MANRIKIIHGVLLLFLLTLILRFDAIFGGVQLLYFMFLELFTSFNSIITKIDLITFDYINSILFFFVIPLLLLKYKNRIKLLNHKLDIITFVFIILSFTIIFSPLITSNHPNAQTDIRATRFLPPFSSVVVLDLSSTANESINFETLQKRLINRETGIDKRVINLSRLERDSIKYSDGDLVKSLSVEELKDDDNAESKIFVLGTDELGRDIFSRVIYGARVSLFIAVLTVIFALLIGVLFGFVAANYGGFFNVLLSRITDVFMSVPAIFFVIMILAFWGNSIAAVIVVLALTGWMSIFKVVKGEIASIIKRDYFIASQKLGLSFWQLLFREILPILIIPLTVAVVFQFSNVILAESALSFLGLGVGINYPSWGNMILAGQKYMASAWWMLVIPSVTLVAVLLSVNKFGEKIKREINPTIKND